MCICMFEYPQFPYYCRALGGVNEFNDYKYMIKCPIFIPVQEWTHTVLSVLDLKCQLYTLKQDFNFLTEWPRFPGTLPNTLIIESWVRGWQENTTDRNTSTGGGCGLSDSKFHVNGLVRMTFVGGGGYAITHTSIGSVATWINTMFYIYNIYI